MIPKKSRILVVSSANMDFIQHTDRAPYPGETVVGTSYDYLPGGKGANSAIALTFLGAECIFCARVGADSNGQRLRAIYREAGIDSRFIFMERKAPTGLASVIIDNKTGQNQIIVFPGANSYLSPIDVEEAFTALPDCVLLQLEIPEKAVIAATMYAAEKEIPVVIDAGPARADYPLDKLYPCEIFSPNETELETFTGIAPKNTESCLRATIRLASMVEAKYYVIKMGSRGVFFYDGKYYNIIPAHDVDAVDTTAAGDIFTAALAAEYMRTGDIMRSIRYANIAGAISVTRAGALNSVPTEEDIAEFIQNRGIKL